MTPAWDAAPEPGAVLRLAARVVLLSDDDRVLLFHGNSDRGPVWTTPGGMVEAGETPEEAAARELWEETGRDGIAIGPCIWERRRVRPSLRPGGSTVDSRSCFFLARTARFELDLTNLPAEEDIQAYRWWTVPEIEAEAPERFIPQRLAALLAPLLAGEVPPEPLDASD